MLKTINQIFLAGRPYHVVIQFLGDDSLSQPLVHGNSKSGRAKPRTPLLPSKAREWERSSSKPAELYDETRLSASTVSDQRLNTPANKEQIRNLQKNFRRQTGSNDIVSVMFALSREYPSIKLMITSPRLVIVQAEPEMIVYAR